MSGWEDDLDEVRAVIAAGDWAGAVARAREAVATWRCVTRFSDFFRPWPAVVRGDATPRGAWTEEAWAVEGVFPRFERLGVDVEGRPVVHVVNPGRDDELVQAVWRWEPDGSVLELRGWSSVTSARRGRVVDGAMVHVVEADEHGWARVELVDWRDGIAVRSRAVSRNAAGEGHERVTFADVRDGEIARLLRSPLTHTGGPLADGLAHAATLDAATVGWDARVWRPEPWPGTVAADALVEPLAQALDRAIRAAAAESGVAEPFLLRVANVALVDAPADNPLPPTASVVGVRWRERQRRTSGEDGAALRLGLAGPEDDVAALPLVDRLDDDALHACRVLSTALRTGAPDAVSEAAEGVIDRLGDRLAELLNARPLDGAADPFAALVSVGRHLADPERVWERVAAVSGPAHVARFRASTAALVENARVTAAALDPGAVAAALTDRGALRALLATTPLAPHAERLAEEAAAEGLVLVPAPATGPPPRSRLGGPPLLPPGTPWPHGRNGTPLAFVAGIDLSELPPGQATAPLPDAGWMLAFAGMGFDAADAVWAMDENVEGTAARLLVADEVVAAEPPAGLEELAYGTLPPRPVVARRILTLPTDYEAVERLGLDGQAAEVYDELLERLYEAVGPDAASRAHRIGGHETGGQGHFPGEDVLLLHVGPEDEPELVPGVLEVRIPPDALAARDWARAFTTID